MSFDQSYINILNEYDSWVVSIRIKKSGFTKVLKIHPLGTTDVFFKSFLAIRSIDWIVVWTLEEKSVDHQKTQWLLSSGIQIHPTLNMLTSWNLSQKKQSSSSPLPHTLLLFSLPPPSLFSPPPLLLLLATPGSYHHTSPPVESLWRVDGIWQRN